MREPVIELRWAAVPRPGERLAERCEDPRFPRHRKRRPRHRPGMQGPAHDCVCTQTRLHPTRVQQDRHPLTARGGQREVEKGFSISRPSGSRSLKSSLVSGLCRRAEKRSSIRSRLSGTVGPEG